MSSITLGDIKPFIEIEDNSSYLVMVAIDKVPPHLAMISNHKYFSLSSKGLKLAVDVNKILESVIRKNIPTLLIKLPEVMTLNIVRDKFSMYNSLSEGGSCLSPIKDVFSSYAQDLNEAEYVFNLIPMLYKKGWVKEVYSLCYNKNTFMLNEYSQVEIDKAIKNAAQLC